MYLPRAFVESDLTELDQLAVRDSFVTLITVRADEPTVSHLPVLYRRTGENIELRGHWARPNPQSMHAGRALAILHGPHAYVSPDWYPDKEAAARVPTWNYTVAHLHGDLTTFDDTKALGDLVTELSTRHEAAVGSHWRFEPGRADHIGQLGGIVGFRLAVDQIELKFKLNQNHPAVNRSAVVRHLETLGGESNRAIASLMQARLMHERISDGAAGT